MSILTRHGMRLTDCEQIDSVPTASAHQPVPFHKTGSAPNAHLPYSSEETERTSPFIMDKPPSNRIQVC